MKIARMSHKRGLHNTAWLIYHERNEVTRRKSGLSTET